MSGLYEYGQRALAHCPLPSHQPQLSIFKIDYYKDADFRFQSYLAHNIIDIQ